VHQAQAGAAHCSSCVARGWAFDIGLSSRTLRAADAGPWGGGTAQDYEQCFNRWYTEKFLKGDVTPACEDLFLEYKTCIMVKAQRDDVGGLPLAAP